MAKIRRDRRSIRLKDYDYASPGAYFVTVCTHVRKRVFGEIVDGRMSLNEFGLIVVEEWKKTPAIREEVGIDTFAVMPNHLHGIVIIEELVEGANCRGVRPDARITVTGPAPKSLGSLINGFKAAVTRQVNFLRHTPGAPLWQRGFYEHVIRDNDSINLIREYIINNPARWSIDRENPEFRNK
ncbi:MAG: transposase [Candidatus Glassbacteria bacterium]|nr:transposase [Candidatus Glassbacteria bacterium]